MLLNSRFLGPLGERMVTELQRHCHQQEEPDMTHHPYIEAVARAICCPLGCEFPGDKCFSYDARETAKAALTTLAGMEPTEGMVEAVMDDYGMTSVEVSALFRAMLSQLAKEIGE